MATFVKFKGSKIWHKADPNEVRQLKKRGENFDVKLTGRSKTVTAAPKRRKPTSIFDSMW